MRLFVALALVLSACNSANRPTVCDAYDAVNPRGLCTAACEKACELIPEDCPFNNGADNARE